MSSFVCWKWSIFILLIPKLILCALAIERCITHNNYNQFKILGQSFMNKFLIKLHHITQLMMIWVGMMLNWVSWLWTSKDNSFLSWILYFISCESMNPKRLITHDVLHWILNTRICALCLHSWLGRKALSLSKNMIINPYAYYYWSVMNNCTIFQKIRMFHN